MPEIHDILCYHGRRSVDELLGALSAGITTAALAHKELSLLHLGRFVSLMTETAGDIPRDEDRLAAKPLTMGASADPEYGPAPYDAPRAD